MSCENVYVLVLKLMIDEEGRPKQKKQTIREVADSPYSLIVWLSQ
jgi:hypothetical protein